MNTKIRRNLAGAIVIAVLVASLAFYSFLNTNQPRTSLSINSTGSGSASQALRLAQSAIGAGGQVAVGPSNRSITVTGTSQVSYVPNEALVQLSVVSVDKTAEAATGANAVSTIAVIRGLNSIGIANSSIATQGYTLYPNYANNYNSNSPPQILGYTVTNSLEVNLTGTDTVKLGLKIGQVIDTAVKAGANQVNLQFTGTTQLLASLNTQALQQAVFSATSQAKTIASALGVKITGVLAASNAYSYYPNQGVYFAAATSTVAYSPTPIMPGTQIASASVQVTYAIG
jgi:uncharacterized protein YggE